LCLTFPSLLLFRGKGLVIDAYSIWFHSGRLTKTRKASSVLFQFLSLWVPLYEKTDKLNTRKRSCYCAYWFWFLSG
ncbi:unnamed protein product, partial [Porites lobata]